MTVHLLKKPTQYPPQILDVAIDLQGIQKHLNLFDKKVAGKFRLKYQNVSVVIVGGFFPSTFRLIAQKPVLFHPNKSSIFQKNVKQFDELKSVFKGGYSSFSKSIMILSDSIFMDEVLFRETSEFLKIKQKVKKEIAIAITEELAHAHQQSIFDLRSIAAIIAITLLASFMLQFTSSIGQIVGILFAFCITLFLIFETIKKLFYFRGKSTYYIHPKEMEAKKIAKNKKIIATIESNINIRLLISGKLIGETISKVIN